jgi:hypothetical protein
MTARQPDSLTPQTRTVRAEIACGEKVSRRLWSKKLEEGIGLLASHKGAERLGARRVFELE